jgi:hypothetical protein
LKLNGDRHRIDKMMADRERGKAMLREERDEVLEATSAGDVVSRQLK